MKLNIVEVANALATLVLVAVLAWAKLRERKLSRDKGLLDNPERCRDHEDRLRDIEEGIGDIKGDIKAIKTKLEMPI